MGILRIERTIPLVAGVYEIIQLALGSVLRKAPPYGNAAGDGG